MPAATTQRTAIQRSKRNRSPADVAVVKKKAAVKKSASALPENLKPQTSGDLSKEVKKSDVPWWARHQIPVYLQQSDKYPGLEVGDGSVRDPFRHIIRETPNDSGCFYCPSTTCDCEEIGALLKETYAALDLKRKVTQYQKRHLCAKSLEQNFVARVTRVLNVAQDDTFYDLGSGNGSVLFQVAYSTGAKCIGVEIDEHNADVSRAAWAVLKPKLEKMAKSRGRKLGSVEIVTGDLCKYIKEPHFAQTAKNVIWTSNLLMPRGVTNFMASRFQLCPPGVRIGCFDDLYPHSRPSAESMYPEMFKLFKMEDYKWPIGAVEWCNNEGPWYIHRRTEYIPNDADRLDDDDIIIS